MTKETLIPPQVPEIVQKGSEILRTKCREVIDFSEAKVVVNDLVSAIKYLKTTYDFNRGIGLAAPQIGITQRISVVEYDGKRYILINPKIIETSKDKKPIKEGCISFFKYRAFVPRYTYVRVEARDLDGEKYIVEGNDDFAMLLQHEIDHLDGILYIDHLENGEADLIRNE